jgi:hypothetical protein
MGSTSEIGRAATDSLKVFRYPSIKEGGVAAGSIQANFEEFLIDAAGNKIRIRNAHVDIEP